MDLKKLAAKAKKTIDDRGGMDALKADAEELKKVAQGKGSLSDKAKAAAKAVKEPGAHRQGRGTTPVSGEKHPAKDAGNPEDTPRKGGPPHA
jgi:hypothetical protein